MSSIRNQIRLAKSLKLARKTTEVFLETLYFASSVGELLYTNRFSYFPALRRECFSKWSDTQITRKLYDMERQGYIKHDRKNMSIKFTRKAKIRIIDAISKTCKTDSKLRFISYDIPEDIHTQRDGFRRAIKRIGFIKVQKSLWACNKNVSELVEDIIDEYKVNKYVTYIVAEKCDTEEYISKKLLEIKPKIKK